MDNLEKTGYLILAIIVGLWFIAIIVGMIAILPFGLIGLLLIVGIGLLLIKVIKERLSNKEDDYYNRNIEK